MCVSSERSLFVPVTPQCSSIREWSFITWRGDREIKVGPGGGLKFFFCGKRGGVEVFFSYSKRGGCRFFLSASDFRNSTAPPAVNNDHSLTNNYPSILIVVMHGNFHMSQRGSCHVNNESSITSWFPSRTSNTEPPLDQSLGIPAPIT